MDPAKSDLLAMPNSGLNLEVHGTGPDLVLLHGWGLNLRVWDKLVDRLAPHFRIITVDLPGHGRSAWNQQRRTLAAQAQIVRASFAAVRTGYVSTPCFVLGWSLGAQIALELAATSPRYFSRLVFVGSTPRFAASADWPHGSPQATLDNFARGLLTDYKQTASDFLELQVRGSAAGNEILSELRSALFAHGDAQPDALSADLDILATSDLRSVLPGITSPTLVVAGQYDRVTPPAASRAMADMLPNSRYVELRRAAHAPFLSHPDEMSALLKEFLLPHDS